MNPAADNPPAREHPTVELRRRLGESALQLCTVPEACELLRISRWQMYQLINRRELGSVKIGRRRLIPLAEISTFITRLRDAGASL